MWRNYVTVAMRALAKNKTYTFINIFGLAIGMAACLMILLFVRYELTYDQQLDRAEDAYQFQTYYKDPDTGEEGNLQMAAYVSKGALLKDFPQIEKVVYAQSSGPVVIRNGEASPSPDNMQYVDGPLLDILRFPFVKGDPATALKEPGSLVLTETEAAKRFGAENPMGQTLTLVSAGKSVDYRVTGIIKDVPKNSHFATDMIARYDPATFWADQPDFLDSYGWQSGWMYVQLKPGTDVAALNAQMKAWEKRNIPDQFFGGQRFNQGDNADFALVNIRDVHLGFAQDGALTPGNDRRSIITFGVVAALILAMACVNFTNLATARASQRAREVALRKVLGANRKQLVVQFVGESILVAGFAMLLALTFVELVMPAFAAFLDADLSMNYVGEGGLLLPIIGLVLLVGAAGGLYPALYLSRFQPAKVLKANKSSADAHGSGRLRNILVVGQFAVSIGLIICTAVVYAQTVYARTADPGYQRDGLLQIEGVGRRQLQPVMDTLLNEIRNVEGVRSMGRTTIGIATRNSTNTGVQLPGKEEPVNIGNYTVDPGFFETMGIKLLAGRLFDEGRAKDDATRPFPEDPAAERAFAERGVNVVVNELAAKRMGFRTPQEAVGKTLRAALVDEDYGGSVPFTIVGVVKDSRFRSIREPVDSIMFLFDRNSHNQLLVRYDGNPSEVRGRIEAAWKRVAPDVPFEAEFSDDIVRELYEAEEARATIFASFAGLSIVVGCLGLFGLAAFTAERRTKEIGIRKVLGARTKDIVRLLVWQFSQPVIIANLIAWPVAWWLMRDWLNTFDTRVDLNPALFLGAGLLAMLIAAGTIIGHAVRVARANPIHALRYE
jgi:putative ABC transport system permease protein